jgi:CHAD domain-containing protein
MAYEFQQDESVQDSVRRCATEQAQRAIDDLRSNVNDDPVGAMHDARKSIKKERSLLRLAAPALDPRERRHENARLRSLSHELGASREAEALLSAVEGLAERYAGQIPAGTVELVRERLRAKRDLARRALLDADVPRQVVKDLRLHVTGLAQLPVELGGWEAVEGGLQRSYRRGRRAMRAARKSPDAQQMHEWRKRSKDLWYHLRLLKQTSPGIVGGAAKDAHRLADALGDSHDLALLDMALRQISDDVLADLAPLQGLLEHRNAQLQTEAFSLGERLYAERPKSFCKRMHRYWRAWRGSFMAHVQQPPSELAESTRQPASSF